MNLHGVRAIYRFEMARTFRTITQSIASPVLSTSLYFVVFGAAIGSRMGEVDGIRYGAFIIPGLVMLSLLNESISNASFGIYMPKWAGTIFEILSAPISTLEIVLGYVGAAATKSVMLGVLILVTARLFVPYEIAHPVWICSASPWWGASTWRPLGSESSSARPLGTEIPGTPARLAGMVARSLRYIAIGSSSFSPSRNAVVGAVGETSTSTRSKAASKSRLMRVRIFCAWP